jgi:hypothetical protein
MVFTCKSIVNYLNFCLRRIAVFPLFVQCLPTRHGNPEQQVNKTHLTNIHRPEKKKRNQNVTREREGEKKTALFTGVRTLFVVSAYAFFFSKQPAHTYKKKRSPRVEVVLLSCMERRERERSLIKTKRNGYGATIRGQPRGTNPSRRCSTVSVTLRMWKFLSSAAK